MKKGKALLAVLLVSVLALALCACGVEVGGEETWEYTAEDKEATVQLFNDFFEKTFTNTNQVVTVKSGEEQIFVETIDGTSDHASYATTGAEVYSFINGDEYIYAMSADGSEYYMVSEDYYNSGYFAYKSHLDMFEMLPEEGLTYSCKVQGSKKGDEGTSTLTLEIKNGEDGSIAITASAKNDLVENVVVTRNEEGTTTTSTFDIVYGTASVTVPDISDWYKAEA